MGKLIYSAIASLDGYVVDASGSFDWAMPDEEVHSFVNELERGIGTYLYGRRMYEVMSYWQNPPELDLQVPVVREYAEVWQAADKVVFSTTLARATTPRTMLLSEFDPATMRAIVATSSHDVSIGGPTLAATAFAAGLIDEMHLWLHPIAVGGGTPALPRDQVVRLELLAERRFASGVAYLHYRVLAG